MAVEITLAEKVAGIMRAGDGHSRSVIDRCSDLPFSLPSRATGPRPEIELDASDWQLYYGIAVGLARTEEPCELTESVAERARAAACKAFLDLNWGSPAADSVRAALRETESVA